MLIKLLLLLSTKPLIFLLVLLTKSSSSQVHHDDEPNLELYMHDVLGTNSPTARPVTGLLGAVYAGRVPFSKPGAGGPGLAGTTPFFRARPGLGFGTVTVIDDALTARPEAGSLELGRARGVYVAGSTAATLAFTAVMEGGEYGDSFNLCGVYVIGSAQTTSRLAVVGGTGKFRNARGFAEFRSLVPLPGQRSETLLRIRVHFR